MTIRIAAAVFILTVATFAQTIPPADKATPKEEPVSPLVMEFLGNYGAWWNALPSDSKWNFVDGYTTAMNSVKFMLVSLCKKNNEELKPGDPEFNAKLYSNLNLCMLSDEYNYEADKSYIPSLDLFYKEPLNVHIPSNFAIAYVRDELRARKTAQQLLDELNDWRKILK